MRVRTALLATLCATLAPLAANAQPFGWSIQPNGEAQYTSLFSASGSFGCNSGNFRPGGSCVVSGNSLTLGNNGAFLTLSFAGISNQVVAASNVSQLVTFGVITKVFSGTGTFLFPQSVNANVPAFGFGLTVTSAIPGVGASTSSAFFNYALDGRTTELSVNCCETDRDYVSYGFLQAPPAGFRYSALVADGFRRGLVIRTTDTATLAVAAQVGVVPEPSTFALGAAGLALVGVAARWRTRER